MPGDFVENAGAHLAVCPKPTDADADLRSCAIEAQRQDGEAGLKVVGRLGIEKAAAVRIESLLADQLCMSASAASTATRARPGSMS